MAKTMSNFHQEILTSIQEIKGGTAPEGFALSYLGTPHLFYCIGTQPKRQIARNWKKAHPEISYEEYISLLDSLYKGKSYEEKTIASELLNQYPKLRQRLDLEKIYIWLGVLEGWAEIDTLCQSSFPAKEVLPRWDDWKKILLRLNKDADIRRRRASLVLLRKTVSESSDPRVAELAFSNIKTVMHEKEVLITKAVSWLLRSLIKHHQSAVAQFIKEHEDQLPKIALRETRRKLETGKK